MKCRSKISLLFVATGMILMVGLSTQGQWMTVKAEGIRQPLNMNVHMLQNVADFLAANDRAYFEPQLRSPDMRDNGVLIPVARAGAQYGHDSGAVALTYAAPNCAIAFPAGRQAQIRFEGPRIVDAYSIYPLEPMDWEQMQAMVARTVDLFETAGWPVKERPAFGPPTQVLRAITEDQLNRKSHGTKTVQIGYWTPCDAPHVEAFAEVRHLNSAPSGASIPPMATGERADAEAPDRFVMRVSFRITDKALEEKAVLLRDARRQDLHQDPRTHVALSVWLDDPHWRPENWENRQSR